MRFSCIAVTALALTSTSLAAPLKRGFFGSIQNAINGVIHGNATLSGIAGTVVQSIENPALTAARLTVIKGLTETQSSLSQIDSQAKATGNNGVSSLVATGQAGLSGAHQGISNIGQALISGNTPSLNDQKNVAIGIKAVRDAINQMPAAVTTPDSTLSNEITAAQSNVQTLQNGGLGVLTSSGLSFAKLGLPDNFATS